MDRLIRQHPVSKDEPFEFASCEGREPFSANAGQGTVEYILILAVIVLGASQIGKRILYSFDLSVLRIGAELERDLKSGRAPLSVWSN